MVMEQKTLKDLAELEKKDREHFIHCLDLCEEKAKIFRMEFEFDFRDFCFGIPKTEKEFLSMFPNCDSHEVTKSITQLFCYIDEAVEKEHLQNIDFFTKTYDDFDVLEQRINFERLITNPYVLANMELIPKENILEFIINKKPSRKNYISSSVIRLEEYNSVIERFGLVGILSSLDPESYTYKKAISEIKTLKDFLNNTDIKIRISPKKFRKGNSEIYEKAVKIFKRYEWALMDLCGHSYNIHDFLPFKKEAYNIFINDGKRVAEAYLREYKISKNKIAELLLEFKNRGDNFRGMSSRVGTSEFEGKIEKHLIDAGVFYRRQLHYKKIFETNKNYIMDFLIGKTVIEVGCIEDCFMHDDNYFERIEEKREIVEQSGYSFLFIDDSIEWNKEIQEAIKQASVPAELYELEDPEPRFHILNKVQKPNKLRYPFFTSRQTYFATGSHTKGPMIGNMHAKSVV